MFIETICSYPSELVMGVSAGIGAAAYAVFSICKKKKELGDKFVFEPSKILDTAWQSITMGVVAGSAMVCGAPAIVIAILTGVGIDKVTNMLKINEVQVINIVNTVMNLISKKK